MMTLEQLLDAGVTPTAARTVLAPLQAACARFDIDTPARKGAFVGECIVESVGFTEFEENLWWTTPERLMAFFPSRVTSLQQASQLVRNPQALANCVYASKNGNGDAQSGDGWKYRGRGGIQLTCLGNYRDAAVALGRPYIEQPDLVAQAPDAILTAAWYWHTHKLNLLADGWQIDPITRAINGPAMANRVLRRQRADQAQRAFSQP